MIAFLALQGSATGAGNAVGIPHPVMEYGIDRKELAVHEEAVRRIMGMSERELLSFIPPHGYALYCECPRCYGGVQGNDIFLWSIERPEELKCRFCGTIVFPNPAYREDRLLTGQNNLGERIDFPYHYNEDKKVSHFFSSHLWLHKRRWLLRQCSTLARLYLATGKREYALRVVRVLDRIAKAYPHYPVMQNSPRQFNFLPSQSPPWPWDAGRWGYFHNEIPSEVIRVYDMVYGSPAFDQFSKEVGYDVREKIERDFLRPAFDAYAAQPYKVSNVTHSIGHAALLGRVINEPRYVHRAFQWLNENIRGGFFYDGMWKESPAYHHMTVQGLGYSFDMLRGYSDPQGYRPPGDGRRFDSLDPYKESPFWDKIRSAPWAVSYPTGWAATVHDTEPYALCGNQPRTETISAILPGFGHAVLGRGRGRTQMQAHLHFSGSYGHAHYDNLNLAIWAKEREMIPDIGYTHTQMRYWATSTLGHNTVVVNRRDQSRSDSDGNLLTYIPDSSGVSLAEADGTRAYSAIKDLRQYRRLLIMIPVSSEDAYVVDIFRVAGGETHDWTIQGDADRDSTASSDPAFEGRRTTMLEQGEGWREPSVEWSPHNPYGMIRDVRTAQSDGIFRVTYAYRDNPASGLKMHMISGEPCEVFLGRSPSVRRAGQESKGDMRKAYDYWMPKLIVRRQAPAPLESVFASVHEPYRGSPFLRSVRRLAVSPQDSSVVAIQVSHGNAVDTIISTLDEAPFPIRTVEDGITLQGRTGIVRREAGRITGAWLFSGEKLAEQTAEIITGKGEYTGEVEGATRRDDGQGQDAFITEKVLPEGHALRGIWMIVTHANGHTHGYEIQTVERRNDKTIISVSSDHALRIKGEKTAEVFFPQREMTGKNKFRIGTVASRTYGQGKGTQMTEGSVTESGHQKPGARKQ